MEEVVTRRRSADGQGADLSARRGSSRRRRAWRRIATSTWSTSRATLKDAWLKHYAKQTNLYPILDAFRDTRGPRWEVRVTNRAPSRPTFRIAHVYNRLPWGYTDPADLTGIARRQVSAWVGLLGQDTTHFSMIAFTRAGNALRSRFRPVGANEAVEDSLRPRGAVRVYLPPYPGKGEKPTTPEEAIDAILAELKKHARHRARRRRSRSATAAGCRWARTTPTAASTPSCTPRSASARCTRRTQRRQGHWRTSKAVGVPADEELDGDGLPQPADAERTSKRARARAQTRATWRAVALLRLRRRDRFREWLGMLVDDEIGRAQGGRQEDHAEAGVSRERWLELAQGQSARRQVKDYWLPTWGPFNAGGVPSRLAAPRRRRQNPRLYVDSLLFYEETAIRFAADGAKAVKAALGDDVLCGANYSCHPFYYPHSTMYIKWFRGGAADLGRHSEYFWQVAQPGPMINGYIAEHFRAGMRDNPEACSGSTRCRTAPGNTDASFLRSRSRHLAHGATMLDFFGIGLNETFTENHIDHRATCSASERCATSTHCVGFVEDLLPEVAGRCRRRWPCW